MKVIERLKLTRRKEGNDLRNDKGKNPGNKQDAGPASPSHDGVTMQVHRVAKRAEEDEAGRHRSIQASKENKRWDHKGK